MGLFSDSVTFPDGRVIYVPSDARYASIFLPNTGELMPLMDSDFGIGIEEKFSRGVLLLDGRVAFIPDRNNSVFVYNEGVVETEGGSENYFSNTGTTNEVEVTASEPFVTGYEFTPPQWATHADVLVVAGGGAAATSRSDNAGGGAGGLIFRPDFVLDQSSYNIQVGNGGEMARLNGINSQFGPLVAIGGGGGSPTMRDGDPGGSGGGAGRNGGIGGQGQQPGQGGDSGAPYGFGNPGGDNDTSGTEGSGGGGAGAPGQGIGFGDSPSRETKAGGDGMYEAVIGGTTYNFAAIYGTNYGQEIDNEIWFAGGGGGGGEQGNPTQNLGGRGGGGRGGHNQAVRTGENGMRHTGGGGGGGDNSPSGNGGSGIVLVRLKDSAGTQPNQSQVLAFHHGITINFSEINVRPDGFSSHDRLYSDALTLPDGKILLIPYDIGYLGVWDPFVDPAESFALMEHNPMESTNLCGQLLPDGTVFLASHEPGQHVYRWDPTTPDEITQGPVWNVGVQNMILDERGVLIAVTSDTPSRILEWSLQSGPIDPAFVRFVS